MRFCYSPVSCVSVSSVHVGGPATFAIAWEPPVSVYKGWSMHLPGDRNAQRVIYSMVGHFVFMTALLNQINVRFYLTCPFVPYIFSLRWGITKFYSCQFVLSLWLVYVTIGVNRNTAIWQEGMSLLGCPIDLIVLIGFIYIYTWSGHFWPLGWLTDGGLSYSMDSDLSFIVAELIIVWCAISWRIFVVNIFSHVLVQELISWNICKSEYLKVYFVDSLILWIFEHKKFRYEIFLVCSCG